MSILPVSINDLAIGLMIDDYNQARNCVMNSELSSIELDYHNAMKELNYGKLKISSIIYSNRGDTCGMHGFIGEATQVYASNAKSLALGNGKHYMLLDNNGPVDYLRDQTMIQQKACASGKMLGLDHVINHATKYPFYVTSGGIYQIPSDFYNRYIYLSELSEVEAGKLLKPDYRLWLKIKKFNENSSGIIIEPMDFTYDDIQVANIDSTISCVENNLAKVHNERIIRTVNRYSASITECIKVSSYSALIDAGIEGIVCINDKASQGVYPNNYSSSDLKDIAINTVQGLEKGAITGAVSYVLTNTLKIPGPIASSTISISSNVIKDTIKYHYGKTNKEEFKKNVMTDIKDGTISSLATFLGAGLCSVLIPSKTPCKKVLTFAGGIASNYLITKATSTLRSFLSEPIKARQLLEKGAIS